jgi:tetratricopeptide (TPR) repeat protein
MLPVGVGLVVLLLWRQSRRPDGRSVSLRWLNVLALASLAGGLGLAALGITTSQWDALVDKDLSKLMIVKWAQPLVRDHSLVGIGRGAFETVYPAYRPIPGNILWTHPENLLVQWAAEWGIPVALAAVAFFGWLLRPSRVGATRSAVAGGAVAGVSVLILQNAVDFSLELPSVAIAVVVLIGAVWADTDRRGVSRWHAGSKREREREGARRERSGPLGWAKKYSAAVALGSSGLMVGGLAWAKGIPTPLADRMAFHSLSKASPLPRDSFDPLIRAAMLRHPAEPYLPLVGAERAERAGDANPVQYLERVLTRAKTYGRAHLLLARILLRRGAIAQGLMELKLACRDEPGLAPAAAEEAVRYVQDQQMLTKMVPDGVEGAKVMDTLGAVLERRAPQAGRHFDEAALSLDPSLTGPRLRRARAWIAALRDPNGQQCQTDDERRACLAAVEDDAKWIQAALPRTSDAARLRADALLAADRAEQAADLLGAVCEHAEDRLPCLQDRVRVLARLRRDEEVDQVLRTIASEGCTSTASCTGTWMWIGAFSASQGNPGAALNAYRKAATYDSNKAEVWTHIGDAAEALSLHTQAAEAYEQAARLSRDSAALRQKADAAKARAVESWRPRGTDSGPRTGSVR